MNPLATGWIETLVIVLGAVIVIARAAVHAGLPFSLAGIVEKNRAKTRIQRWAGAEANNSVRDQQSNHSKLSEILSL